MPSLIDIRRRVRSVKNTQQITKAMKMVSAAKLRKAQERAIAARPYAKVLQQMLANVAEAAAQAGEGETHPLLVVRPEKKNPSGGDHGGWRLGGRVQREPDQAGAQLREGTQSERFEF